MHSKGAKRKKKIVAVALAAATCLGLSMTAFAATEDVTGTVKTWNSPNEMDKLVNGSVSYTLPDGTVVYSNTSLYPVTDKEGNRVEYNTKKLSTETLESINTEDKVRDILKKAGYDIKDNWDLIPTLAADVTLDGDMPSGGAYAWVNIDEKLNAADGYQAGQKIQVLRETYSGSGVWEVVEAELVEDEGRLRARVAMTNKSQSMVVIRVMSDGRTVRVINKVTGEQVVVPAKPGSTATPGSTTGTSNNASATVSPKTGEF